jgi:hypothetical protein
VSGELSSIDNLPSGHLLLLAELLLVRKRDQFPASSLRRFESVQQSTAPDLNSSSNVQKHPLGSSATGISQNSPIATDV